MPKNIYGKHKSKENIGLDENEIDLGVFFIKLFALIIICQFSK